MIDFTKKESIATLEKHGWKYHGFLDAGWGEKYYTLTNPEGDRVLMRLNQLRHRAYRTDMYHWFGQQTAKERVGL